MKIVVSLWMVLLVAGLTAAAATAEARQHHVHRHREGQYATVTVAARGLMPSLTDTADLALSTSYSYSIAVPAADGGPGQRNPYIMRTDSPDELVFIIVGCVIAAMLIAFGLYRMATYIKSNHQARTEKEVYLATPGFRPFAGLGGSSSNSSFLEKSSFSSLSSLNLLQRNNSSNALDASDGLTLDSARQGRSYQNAFQDGQNRRNSMFFSPVGDFMSGAQPQPSMLPLYSSQNRSSMHPGHLNRLSVSLANTLHAPLLAGTEDSSPASEYKSYTQKRPPSVSLDDLLEKD